MADAQFEVAVSAGSLRTPDHQGIVMPHQWTPEGVVIQAEFTGAHLYHLAAAGCVLNDLYREAERLGITLQGAQVRAAGEFDRTTWSSTGIEYAVDIASEATDTEVNGLLAVVDEVAEIPRALRCGTSVTRKPTG